MSSGALLETLRVQEGILRELWEVTIRQREALKGERLSALQDQMRELQHLSVRAQAAEVKRGRLSRDLAEELGCDAVLTEICAHLPQEEARSLEEAGADLLGAVGLLRAEMKLLGILMEESRTLNEMMLGEWRRLAEIPMGSGGFDTRI
ncbi:conserved hypothetical protein [Aminomonas paucivorans DSM 12260]|uniref:FlgN family protein n=1 Tax=Aminomonas paucivorans DSM 12260 TaxID=584708 RepID=E3CXD0_9BACT|nr:flagellar export chaperone FlgN [Aminomonas paucivorans]EFQ23496.1 conserved hypothetical protein [Aminomonas paucivorans DSM 12260]